MYQIRPETAKTFLDDRSIQLPRFQRPLKWEEHRLFHFVLSVYKQYPLGVVVVKVDKDKKGRPVKFLLDGRQRRYALEQMRNPEQVYRWAQKTIGFKANNDPHQIAEKFREYLDEYFGKESELGESIEPDHEEPDEGFNEPSTFEDRGAPIVPVLDSPQQPGLAATGLQQLLKLIVAVHPLKKNYSGFTKPFLELGKVMPGLSFMAKDSETGKSIVNTLKLMNWLENQRKEMAADGIPYPPERLQFVEYLVGKSSDPKLKQSLTSVVDSFWQRLENLYDVLGTIDDRFTTATVGYLELQGSNANDDKKIFEIINSAGEKLTAIEILSAKPSWNTPVLDPDPIIVKNKDVMYSRDLNLNAQGLVRWDVPATLLERLVLPDFFRPEPGGFDKASTLGFKLFAGNYRGGVNKIDIEKMGADDSIPWSTRSFDTALSEVGVQLAKNNVFRYAESWHKSLYDLTSVAVYVNFMLVMLKDWQRKKEPRVPGRSFEQFQRNGVILYDRMIYEYITGKWRGSSDSKIAGSLNALDNSEEDVFEPIRSEAWRLLVEEILQGTIDGEPYTSKLDGRIKVLLYYMRTIRRQTGPKALVPEVDVDHIIPESRILAHQDPNVKSLAHHIGNLALLPGDVNLNKSSKALNELKDRWTIDQVEIYEGISRQDFGKYSKPEDVVALVKARHDEILKTLTSDREEMLSTMFKV